MDNGWVKLYRSIWKNPVVTADSDYLAVWIYLLTSANYEDTSVRFKGKRVYLKPGEMITGRKKISQELGVSESKVQRILKEFESEQQIEQRTDRHCRLISIQNWEKYQSNEQQNEQQVNNYRTTTEQQVNNYRTTTEQQVNTNKEYKNIRNKEIKNIRNKEVVFTPPTLQEVRAYCLERGNSVDPERFVDFYSSKGWMIGKNKMKDWRACVRTWERGESKEKSDPYLELFKEMNNES